MRPTRLSQILDLFAKDDQLINVYAGELEMRPPGAPTTWVNQWIPGSRDVSRVAFALKRLSPRPA
jgi:hypothetical protein